MRGTVYREETLRERPKPLLRAVPAMREQTARVCSYLGWGVTRREEIRHGCGVHKNKRSWWHGLVRGACQSDLTGPSLYLGPAQPCVFSCLNIKAVLSVNSYASIQDMPFYPKILSTTYGVVTDAMSQE